MNKLGLTDIEWDLIKTAVEHAAMSAPARQIPYFISIYGKLLHGCPSAMPDEERTDDEKESG